MAKLLGVIIGEWSHAEQALSILFSELVGARNMATIAAFERITSLNQKVNILLSLCENKIAHVQLRKHVMNAIAELQKQGKKRDKYAHARWAAHPECSEELVLLRPGPKMIKEARLYGESDFQKLIDDIDRATAVLYAFMDEVNVHLRQPTIPKWAKTFVHRNPETNGKGNGKTNLG